MKTFLCNLCLPNWGVKDNALENKYKILGEGKNPVLPPSADIHATTNLR